MGKIVTFDEVVKKSVATHGNKYKYLRIERVGSVIKVVCECPRHGEFSLRAARHYTDGKGCPKCSKSSSVDEFIARASIKHGDKYDYSLVKFSNLADKITIVCPEHGPFTQKANNHILYYGCAKCGIEKRSTSKTKDTKWFIDKSVEVHGDRYDYSKTVYTKAMNKVTITCKVHGDFSQTAVSHTSGKQGCPACGGIYGKTTEEFVRDAVRVHGNKYDYSKTKYVGALEKVIITCPTHGDFEQIASNHIIKSGCPHCSVTGFDVGKPGILYYIEIVHDNVKYYKIGITNLTVQQRFTSQERSKISIIAITEYARGEEAYVEEQRILKKYESYKYNGPDILKSGNTEIFTINVLGGTDE